MTLRVEAQPGEVTSANNEMSTYVTVAKEGLSVLYVEGKMRVLGTASPFAGHCPIRASAWITWSASPMSRCPRPRQKSCNSTSNTTMPSSSATSTAKRLSGGDPLGLARIENEIKKGTGLMMIGGFESFGNSDWQNTPIATVLPVRLDANGQVEKLMRMVPTAKGLDRYVMRLTDKLADNRDAWEKLPRRKTRVLPSWAGPRKGPWCWPGRTIPTTANRCWSAAPMAKAGRWRLRGHHLEMVQSRPAGERAEQGRRSR